MSLGTKKESEIIANDPEPQPDKKARRPRSIAWKIAFWTSLIGAIANLGGVASLAALSGGSVDVNTIITAILWVISVIIFATRFRWAPLAGLLISLANIYLLAAQPYVVNSLANPKTDPNGGISHFIGDMLIIGCVLLILVASLAALQQTTHQEHFAERRQAPGWFGVAIGIVVGIVIGSLFIGAMGQPATSGTTYTNGLPTVHMSADSYNQSSVTLTKGSKLLLVDDVSSLHILAIGSWQNGTPDMTPESGAPLVKNIQVNGGSIQIGPFMTAGTYHILCVVHRGMDLTVIVQ